jgi:putative membrane protein
MIHYNPKSWFSLIFHAYNRQVIRKLLPAMAAMGLFTAAICYIELEVLEEPMEVSNVVHSLLGFVLSLFLVFRTNTAYDRWWEGRKQWGGLVNVSRTLAIRVREFSDDQAAQAYFAEAIPGFVKALRDHLRPSQPSQPSAPAAPAAAEFADAAHVPNAWAQGMERRAHAMLKAGDLTDQQHWLIAKNLERMVDILGACERILKTPVPYSYSMFLKKFIFLYVVTLPIGFVATFAWWSVPVVMLVFYILVSVELIAEEIEDPFGVDENDLPLDGLCETIQGNVEEILSRT